MKSSINFDLGVERFYINNSKDKYLEFNPLDTNLYDKFLKLQAFFESIDLKEKNFSNENDIMCFIGEQDIKLKSYLDDIFGVGACERVFGTLNLFTPTQKGTTIFENFIEALTPIIEKSATVSHENSLKRIEKYTKKYQNEHL